MPPIVERYSEADLPEMLAIWNKVVEVGKAFPQENLLNPGSARDFFGSQSWCGVAREIPGGAVEGLYILHPNNVGRCGHICNASYAVGPDARGRGLGRALVCDSLKQAERLGFRIMQFNAVVAGNHAAHHLYRELGFESLGRVKGGFRNREGEYEDICLYWRKTGLNGSL